jgi:hypothetical protein
VQNKERRGAGDASPLVGHPHSAAQPVLQHATRNVRHATCNMQHTTCNTQRATCSIQRATLNVQHTTCSIQRAAYSMKRAQMGPAELEKLYQIYQPSLLGELSAMAAVPPIPCPSFRPHLRRDWAHPAHICAGTGLTPAHISTGTARPACVRAHHRHVKARARTGRSVAHCRRTWRGG